MAKDIKEKENKVKEKKSKPEKKVKDKKIIDIDKLPEKDIKIVDFYMSAMVSITLKNGTRISWAENTSFEQAAADIETFKQLLENRRQESLNSIN